MANILPDSRTAFISTPKASVWNGSGYSRPIFCASCGVEGGMVPEENMTFAFWLCRSCFATYGDLTNVMVMPDEIFFQKVKEAQLEKYGRNLTAEETLLSLSDPNSLESRLARDRKLLTPIAGA